MDSHRVTRDTAAQRVEHAVARILAETDRPVEVYAAVLEAIGRSLGWELGAVWEVGPDDGRLRCVRTWHAGDGAPEFEALSERIVARRRARACPGGCSRRASRLDRRRAGRRELPARGRRPPRRPPRRVRLPAAEPARAWSA